MARRIERREFIVSATAFAGGLALSVARPREAAARLPEPPGGLTVAGPSEFTPWIAIAPDDTVTVRVATPEIGNGVMTQAAMTVTEELGCSWAHVRTEFASVERDFVERGIYSKGSGVVPWFSGHSTDAARMQVLLQAGASARERLKLAAARSWRVPVGEIGVANSVLTHTPSGRTLRFGEVAARAARLRLAAEPSLKPRSEWTFLGKASPPKLNTPLIVAGSAVFGIDVREPGMVYAALRQSPVHGGKLIRFEADVARAMPGIRAIVVLDSANTAGAPVAPPPGVALELTGTQSAIAVIADHYWQARRALETIRCEWDDGAGARWSSHEQIYGAISAALDSQDGFKVDKHFGEAGATGAIGGAAGGGDPATGQSVSATYLTPYCEQAPLEPLNGTARVTAGRVDVWHPAQDPRQGFWIAVDECGCAPERVAFHQTFVGGAFGRRVHGAEIRMVVAVARQYPGVPVQVIWSREEMFRQGRYRPPIAARYAARLGRDGLPQQFHARAVLGGYALKAGLVDAPYADPAVIPDLHIESRAFPLHLLTGPFRAPGYNSFAFMTETFIDECAVAAGVDPLEYRIRLLRRWPDAGWVRCLQVVAAKSGWGARQPRGIGQGIAISNWGGFGTPHAGTTVAVVATVEVSRAGELKIRALDVAFDCGRTVNRAAVLRQVEGAILFGLNVSVHEELTIRDGAIVEGNFHEYRLLRQGEVPALHVHDEALSGDDRCGMIGEAPVGPVGPALGNAIFQACGRRLRSTPFSKQDLRWT